MNQTRLNVNAPLTAVVARNRGFGEARINDVVGVSDAVSGDHNLLVTIETLYAVALRNHRGLRSIDLGVAVALVIRESTPA
jgi:hypothetical protein